MNILIFAGGSGTRLWPASRKSKPKQLLKFVGDDTLLQHTYKRVKKGNKVNQVFIATSNDYEAQIRKQLPSLPKTHYSLEPIRRNRGPALGLAVLIMNHFSNDKIFATAWADDYIKQDKIYHDALNLGANYIKKNINSVVAIGIKPTSPHTGFCYIQTGHAISQNKSIFTVNKFTKKPSQLEAKKYLASKNFVWNTGYFISHTDHILNLYKQYRPEVFNLLMKIKPYIGTSKQIKMIAKYYKQMPDFDFEEIFNSHPKQLKAIKAKFDWADIGRWSVIKDIQSKPKNNLVKGLTLSHQTEGTLIYNYNKNQLVTTVHTKNLIIVVTPESVLVADKEKSEELKDLISKIKANPKLTKYL